MSELCLWCDEPVLPGEGHEMVTHFANGRAVMRSRHRECAARSMIGGLNHLQRRCTCCGGSEPPDPPDMTRRQAAAAALAFARDTNFFR